MLVKKAFLLFSVICILFSSFICYASEKKFDVELSSSVTFPGRQVRLKLFLPADKEVTPPEMPFMNGVSFKFIGKKVAQMADGDRFLVYEYSVVPTRIGEYSIGPLITVFNGDVYMSRPVKLRVEKGAVPFAAAGGKEKNGEFDLSRHIFLELAVPEREPYLNEKFKISLKVVSDWLDLEDLRVVEPVTSENLISGRFVREKTYIRQGDRKKYIVVEYEKEAFSPFAGEYRIDPFSVTFNIVMPSGAEKETLNDNLRVYSDHLGRKRSREETLKTGPVKISVQALPDSNVPGSFKGAVGSFSVDMERDMSEYRDNNTVIYKTRVTGKGNFDTVMAPEIDTGEGVRLLYSRQKGIDGGKIFEQAVRVETPQMRNVPEAAFSYFDPVTREYVEIKEETGQVIPVRKEGDIESGDIVGKLSPDEEELWITSLKTPGPVLRTEGYFLFFPIFIIIMFGLPALLFVYTLFEYRRYWIMTSDSPKAILMRARLKAGRLLGDAAQNLKKGKQRIFYDRLFRALQVFFGEILFLSSANVNEDNVIEALKARKSGYVQMGKMVRELMADCYRGKYADIDISPQNMKMALNTAKKIMDTFSENGSGLLREGGRGVKGIERAKQTAVTVFIFFLFLFLAGKGFAEEKEFVSGDPAQVLVRADSFYDAGEYDKAVVEYQKIIERGYKSTALFFNAGNAYLKREDTGRAVLNFERAYLRAPRDRDISFNRKHARSLIKQQDMAYFSDRLSTYLIGVFNKVSIRESYLILAAFYIMALLFISLALFYKNFRYFFAGLSIMCFISAVFTTTPVRYKHKQINNGAIVIDSIIDAKYEPSGSAETRFPLYEGNMVYVIRKSGSWLKIRRPDGKIGWVSALSIAKINI